MGTLIADRGRAVRAQPLLCLSAVQAQKLVAVSAQYKQQTAVLVAQRCELYKAMRPPAPPRPNACQEELISDFLLVRPAADPSWPGMRGCSAPLQIVDSGEHAGHAGDMKSSLLICSIFGPACLDWPMWQDFDWQGFDWLLRGLPLVRRRTRTWMR